MPVVSKKKIPNKFLDKKTVSMIRKRTDMAFEKASKS
jgi:hypothetical protein